MYLRVDGKFATAPQAFHVTPSPGTTQNNASCDGAPGDWTFYIFANWQTIVGEDLQSLVQGSGFKTPVYQVDDFSLPAGSPGVGFVPFDPTQAGRNNLLINPPTIPATFVTATFDPTTSVADY
jgi:hypothetical protein